MSELKSLRTEKVKLETEAEKLRAEQQELKAEADDLSPAGNAATCACKGERTHCSTAGRMEEPGG